MIPSNETAAICGLFCGACPFYPSECEGCLSEKVIADCQSCGSGFRSCTQRHGITRCYECSDFPCARLEAFSKKHVVNGICHHAHVIEDLRQMGEVGVESWVAAQTQAHTCSICGGLVSWFEHTCQRCKN